MSTAPVPEQIPSASASSNETPSEPRQRTNGPAGFGRRWWWVAGLALAAVVVTLAAAFASPDPDGLERVAEDLGFLHRAGSAPYHLIPDYLLPGVADPFLATVGAGLVGLLVVVGIVVGLGFLLRRRSA